MNQLFDECETVFIEISWINNFEQELLSLNNNWTSVICLTSLEKSKIYSFADLYLQPFFLLFNAFAKQQLRLLDILKVNYSFKYRIKKLYQHKDQEDN